jgi:hypothetical protein
VKIVADKLLIFSINPCKCCINVRLLMANLLSAAKALR